MTQRPLVLLLIPHLGNGGAERVIALLASNLSPEKYELCLGLVTEGQVTGADACVEPLPAWVRVYPLGAPRVRAATRRILGLVWKLRPDIILSGMAHLNFLVLLLRPFFPQKTRILVRQNGTVSAQLASEGMPFYTRMFYRRLYRHADSVICQTRSMAKDLAAVAALPAKLLTVLPNPIDVEEIRRATHGHFGLWAQWDGPGPHLLAVGRLSAEKGFDLLLQAFAVVRRRFPSACLLIAGAGPEEAALCAQSRLLEVNASVRFTGRIVRTASYFPGATLFVLSSRHEGLPNALLEAATAGLPLVALPASEGVADLLRDQPGAWLAPEVSAEALAVSLLAALDSLRPGERFPHRWIEEFHLDWAIHAYEQHIDAILTGAQK